MNGEQSVHVLVVDDDPELLEMVAVMLRQHDEILVTAESTVAEALDTFDASFVDCIVSDYDMPGMDGLDFLTAVRWHNTDVPFIMTTAHGSEGIASEAIRSGATDYIVKEGDWVSELYDHVHSAVVARDEGELTHANTRFQRAIGALDEYAIVMLDRDGHIVTWNDGAELLTGRPTTEAIGSRVHDLFVDCDAIDDLLEHTRETGGVSIDHTLERPGGTTVPVRGQVTHVPGPLAEPTYFAAVLHQKLE